jgi:antirestriction protein ArdC
MNINALYEGITNSMIKEMEAGAVPWVKPWETPRNHGSVMPHNLATGRSYSDINIPLLWGAADAQGYTAHEWMTYQRYAKAKEERISSLRSSCLRKKTTKRSASQC